MSMVVKNNLAAQMTLGELNKNVNKAGVLLGRVASGQKINSAKDDAAGFAISEKMREQIRSLTQDNQNVQNGSSMLKTASGGVDNIVEELRNLKELALNSANDTNTDQDRATIQKEFSQKMANINDIATTTNYNGKTLLDGTYKQPLTETTTDTITTTTTIATTTKKKGAESSLPPNYTSIYKEVAEPTGATQTISGTDFTITSDGIYEIASGFTGTIAVNAQNVKLTSSNTLNEFFIEGPNVGNANLWIENLNITNSTDKSFIKLKGNNNVLTVSGNNNFENTATVAGGGSGETLIDIGNGANVQGYGDNNLFLKSFLLNWF